MDNRTAGGQSISGGAGGSRNDQAVGARFCDQIAFNENRQLENAGNGTFGHNCIVQADAAANVRGFDFLAAGHEVAALFPWLVLSQYAGIEHHALFDFKSVAQQQVECVG